MVDRLKLLAQFKRLDLKKAKGLTESEQKLYDDLLRRIGSAIDSKSTDNLQKRQDLRVPVGDTIQIKSSRDFEKLYIKNISGGGFYIESKKFYEMGSKIEFELDWVDKKRSIKFLGEVAWVNPRTIDDLQPGMGVKFVEMSSEQKSMIHDMIHELLTKAISTAKSSEKNKK